MKIAIIIKLDIRVTICGLFFACDNVDGANGHNFNKEEHLTMRKTA